MDNLRTAVGAVWLVLIAACGRADARSQAFSDSAAAFSDSVARARQDSINRAQPGYIVDSILPVEEELRRFRDGLGPAPAGLRNAARSRDELVARFVSALESGDSLGLARLAVDRLEFAWLIYPSSPFTRPPYRQAPGLVWMQLSLRSSAGYSRLVGRLAGHSLGHRGYECNAPIEAQGANRFWHGCSLRLTWPNGTLASRRFFGSIVERDGRFKLMGF